MNTSHDALGSLSIGEPTTVRNLTVFPLLDKERRVPGYLLLAEALARGTVTISEISESGAVPSIRLDNRGDLPVLLLDGEHLVGCKQNRIVNTSILVPAHAETRLPVSCVEHGRWSAESRHFEASDRAMFAELRAAKVAQVTQSLHLPQVECAEVNHRPVENQGQASQSVAFDSDVVTEPDTVEPCLFRLSQAADELLYRRYRRGWEQRGVVIQGIECVARSDLREAPFPGGSGIQQFEADHAPVDGEDRAALFRDLPSQRGRAVGRGAGVTLPALGRGWPPPPATWGCTPRRKSLGTCP